MEASILRVVKDKDSVNPEEIARTLGISEKSAITLVCRLVEKGELKITGIARKS